MLIPTPLGRPARQFAAVASIVAAVFLPVVHAGVAPSAQQQDPGGLAATVTTQAHQLATATVDAQVRATDTARRERCERFHEACLLQAAEQAGRIALAQTAVAAAATALAPAIPTVAP